MTFRESTLADLPQAWQIILDAKRMMIETGRKQWTEEYPSYGLIEADIASGDAYVICDGGGTPRAYAYITARPEPAYDSPGAHWLSNGKYMVIHRLAVGAAYRGKGLARMMLAHAEALCRNHGIGSIKIDTSHDNAEMLGLIGSLGYAYCGTVSYGTRGERAAFEKTV